MLALMQPKPLENPVQQAQELGTWIKHDGFLLVFGSVVLLFGITFMTIWLQKYYHDSRCHYKDGRRKCSDLINHPFFGSMDLYLHTKVLTLNLPEKGRELIFKDFLKFKFEAFINNTQQWLLDNMKKLEEMEPEALRNSVLAFVSDSVQEYEQKARKEGIPEIVINKFRKFHQPKVDRVWQNITDICDCEWLLATNNVERMGFILNTLEDAFEHTLIDAELTLGDINGDLGGIVYKGVTVMPFKKAHKHRHTVANRDSDSGIWPALPQN